MQVGSQSDPENVEWKPVSAADDLRQGDVLRSVSDGVDVWRQLLVVVTADCDLVNKKHAGSLSCVSALPYLRYLRLFRTEVMIDKLSVRLLDVFGRLLASRPGLNDRLPISPERLANWFLEKSEEDIVAALDFDTKQGSQAKSYIAAYKNLARCRDAELDDIVEAGAQAKLVLGDRSTAEEASSQILRELSGVIKNLPGDAMFVGSLTADRSDDLRVVYLRRIFDVPESVVARSLKERAPETTYVRASRLAAPYSYALTQQLGAVFSAIGLPKSYEDRRRIAADSLVGSGGR